MEIRELHYIFDVFQILGLNCGGCWRIVEIEKKENNLIDCLKNEITKENKRPKNFRLKLIEVIEWESYFEERVEYWSNFQLVQREIQKTKFNQEEYDRIKAKFKYILMEYLNQNKLEEVYRNDDDIFNWDQISEDFIFVLSKKILIIHFGWSS